MVYPNAFDDFKRQHTQGEHTVPDKNNYKIASDGKTREEIFYIFTSERPLFFDGFKEKGDIKCTNNGIGKQTIKEHQNNLFGDYRQIVVPIK